MAKMRVWNGDHGGKENGAGRGKKGADENQVIAQPASSLADQKFRRPERELVEFLFSR